MKICIRQSGLVFFVLGVPKKVHKFKINKYLLGEQINQVGVTC